MFDWVLNTPLTSVYYTGPDISAGHQTMSDLKKSLLMSESYLRHAFDLVKKTSFFLFKNILFFI